MREVARCGWVAWAGSENDIEVALEARDAQGVWRRAAPRAGLSHDGPAREGWRRSSELRLRAANVTLILATHDSFTIMSNSGPIEDRCRQLRAARSPRTREGGRIELYHWSGEWCLDRSEPIQLDSVVDPPVVRARIAARDDGDCIRAVVEVRPENEEWRAWDAGLLCIDDVPAGRAVTGPALGLQHWIEPNAVGLVADGPEISAVVGGQVLRESCGELRLFGAPADALSPRVRW